MNPMLDSTHGAPQASGQAPQDWISGALADTWSATSGAVVGAGRVASDLAQGTYSEVVNHPLEAVAAVVSAGATALGVGIAVAGAADATAAAVAGGLAVGGSLAAYEAWSLGTTALTRGPAAVPEQIHQNISDLQTAFTTVSAAVATVFHGDSNDPNLLRADQELKDTGAALMPVVIGTLAGGGEGLAVGAVRKAAKAAGKISALTDALSSQGLTLSDIFGTGGAITEATANESMAALTASASVRNSTLAEIEPSARVVSSAIVANSARIGANSMVFPFATIGDGTIISEKVSIYGYASLAERVSVGDHASVLAGVQVGSDSWVGANNMLMPGAKIGEGTHLGSRVWVGRDAVVGDDATIGNSSIIGSGANIGHHVQVGPNALVGENVTVGDNSVIADGAKIEAGTVIPPNSTISQ